MCNSLKGSSKCFRQTKRKEDSRSEYEKYASIMRRASTVYHRIEQEKAERRQFIANQKFIITIEDKLFIEDKGKA